MFPEGHWLRPFVSRAVLGAVSMLVVVPVAIAFEPSRRMILIRLVAALIIGLMLIDLVRAVAGRVRTQPASSFDAALTAPIVQIALDPHFADARDEIRAAAASEIYFTRVLWPRLCELADRLPHRPVLERPAISRSRRLLRRGPTVADIRGVIARLKRP
jgi:hypothetical protein